MKIWRGCQIYMKHKNVILNSCAVTALQWQQQLWHSQLMQPIDYFHLSYTSNTLCTIWLHVVFETTARILTKEPSKWILHSRQEIASPLQWPTGFLKVNWYDTLAKGEMNTEVWSENRKNRPNVRPSQNNIKTDVTGYGGLERVNLAQGWGLWHINELWVLFNAENFLTSWGTSSFPRITVHSQNHTNLCVEWRC